MIAVTKDYDNMLLDYLIARRKTYEKIVEILNSYRDKKHRGKYIVICNGVYIGIYDNINEATKISAKQNAIQCTIAEIGKNIEYKQIELGTSIID